MKQWMIVLLFACWVGMGQSFAQVGDGGVAITPPSVEEQLCGERCHRNTVTVTVPPVPSFSYERLDVMFVVDVSGSMQGVIDTVRDGSEQILQEFARLVPDVRFGVGVLVDYDANPPLPWALLSPMTSDVNTALSAIRELRIFGGGITYPESYGRALWEAGNLDWRANTLRIIVLFGDDLPHDPDRGPDGILGTADDLIYAQVLRGLANRGIRVVAINAGQDYADDTMRQAAQETDGRFFVLSELQDLVQNLVGEVRGIVQDERGKYDVYLRSSIPAQAGWIKTNPLSYPYPKDGGTLTFEIAFCPQEQGFLRGNYEVPLQVRDSERVFGTIDMRFPYVPQCVNLTVPDVVGDIGDLCSDALAPTFWESPSIVVRRAADGGREFEYPAVGKTNYVYVDVINTGVEPANQAQLVLYATDNVLTTDFLADWREVGRQNFRLDPEQTWRSAPIEWVPTSAVVALRAVVTDVNDVPQKLNDYACESNIAQVNRLQVQIDNHTAEPGYISAVVPVQLESSRTMNYEALSLRIEASQLLGNNRIIFKSDPNYSNVWAGLERARLSGGEQESGARFVSRPDGKGFELVNYLSSLGTQTSGEVVFATPPNINALSERIEMMLVANDRVVIGATLEVFSLPSPEPAPQPATVDLTPLFVGLPIVFLMLIGVYTVSQKRS
jgi:Ca2+-binding RTX toxin-like protein